MSLSTFIIYLLHTFALLHFFFFVYDRVAGADRTVWIPVLPGGWAGAVAAVASEGWGSLAEVLCQSSESPHQWNILWTFYIHPLLDLPLWHGACLLR